MAGHAEELSLPGDVVALLGAELVDHSGAGACRVVSGGGLVAKVGPPEVVAREAAVLGTPLPLSVPALVDAGPGWLVMAAEGEGDARWTEDDLGAALGDLARLHDAFAGEVPDRLAAVVRRPFTPEGADDLLAPARRLGEALPGRLAALLADPTLLIEAAAAEPPTLLHGDPWPGNVLRPALGRRVWVDWELASIGPAAADVASWIGQTYRPDFGSYLDARADPVNLRTFRRALDGATVLWFLAYDFPRLAAGERLGAGPSPEDLTTAALAAARRLAFA